MNIYYVQKKERMDSSGSIHLNFNVTLPPDAVFDMELDSGTQRQRAVTVEYDKANNRIIIEKLIK